MTNKPRHPVAKLTLGESIILKDPDPEVLKQYYKTATYHGMKITIKKVSNDREVTRIA